MAKVWRDGRLKTEFVLGSSNFTFFIVLLVRAFVNNHTYGNQRYFDARAQETSCYTSCLPFHFRISFHMYRTSSCRHQSHGLRRFFQFIVNQLHNVKLTASTGTRCFVRFLQSLACLSLRLLSEPVVAIHQTFSRTRHADLHAFHSTQRADLHEFY